MTTTATTAMNEQNEQGLAYLKELLESVRREHPDSDDTNDLDDSRKFKFVLRTLIAVVSSKSDPLEQLQVEMAAMLAPHLLENLFEDEREAFAGMVDLNNPTNTQQRIAAILAHAVRIFGQRLRDHRRPVALKYVPANRETKAEHGL